jgi:hypothetical protein
VSKTSCYCWRAKPEALHLLIVGGFCVYSHCRDPLVGDKGGGNHGQGHDVGDGDDDEKHEPASGQGLDLNEHVDEMCVVFMVGCVGEGYDGLRVCASVCVCSHGVSRPS